MHASLMERYTTGWLHSTAV